MDLSSSEANLVVISHKTKLWIFCKIYWKIILFVATPIVLLPIYFMGDNDAYPCFFVFLVTVVYWTTDAIHPAVIALSSLALSSLFAFFGVEIITSVIYVTKDLLDCLGVMMIIVAIEHSNVNKRAALKIFLFFGCSHYRISFLLFFSAMFLSMFMSSVITCGLMIPLVKAILFELEKLGIIEMYQLFDKTRTTSRPRKPSIFTSFYFLGIAFSSTIGAMATFLGSTTNQIFKTIFETTFSAGPRLEFPHFMLLNLPGVLLMETFVYLWLNFYFLGMFRSYYDAPLQMSMTDEESQYINTLLSTRYQQLGQLTFHEIIVSAIVLLAAVLQVTSSALFTDYTKHETLMSHIKLSAPSILCVTLLFITPINTDFTRFFRRHSDCVIIPRNYQPETGAPLPSRPTKTCLNWNLVNDSVPWSVLFVIGGSNTMFEALKLSKMTHEFEGFLMLFSGWPSSAQVLAVVVICKILTEYASNSCVAHVLLPHIAKVCVMSKVNPHLLMLAGTLSTSLPFLLMTGSPANAMVLAYVNIPPRNMICAGIPPTILSTIIIWFTVTVWSKAIWIDINLFPEWAYNHTID